jgi:aminoglycoside phosphotransferase (APT) family kinase protein
MVVPAPRDPGVTRDILTSWLGAAARLPGARITDLKTPEFTGFSSEIVMLDVEHDGGTEALAVRVAPLHYQVFPEARFAEQYRLMSILDRATDIPVPPVLWYEDDPGYLGAAFLVMRRIDGRVPTDAPPYHTGGWVTEIGPAERAAMWWSGLDIVARLHRLDADALQLGFLDQPAWGQLGLEQRLGYYEHYMNWAYPGPKPTAVRALAWLKEHRPGEPNAPVLLWGDARIGNMIFAPGGTPRAALDWETATFGQAEEDLAWYLFLDRHHSEGLEVPQLEGFPPPGETIARYEELAGRAMQHMGYYEVLSGFKFTVIMSRIAQAMIEWGWLEPDSDFPYNNNCSRLVDVILEGL